jgi:hypothetical protein
MSVDEAASAELDPDECTLVAAEEWATAEVDVDADVDGAGDGV